MAELQYLQDKQSDIEKLIFIYDHRKVGKLLVSLGLKAPKSKDERKKQLVIALQYVKNRIKQYFDDAIIMNENIINNRELFIEDIKNQREIALAKGKKLIIKLKNEKGEQRFYNISNFVLERLETLINSRVIKSMDIHGSDPDFEYLVSNWNTSEYKFLQITPKKKSDSGAFFNYVNTTKFDLSAVQIYNEAQIKKLKSCENCIIHSLRTFGVPEPDLMNIKTTIRPNKEGSEILAIPNDTTEKRKLLQIAKDINREIDLIDISNDLSGDSHKYYNKGAPGEIIRLYLFQNHYFPDVELPITLFAIKHYEEIKNLRNFNLIARGKDGKYKRNLKATTKVSLIVKEMWKQGFFEPNILLSKFIQNSYCNNDNRDFLENIEKEQSKVKVKYEDLKDDIKEKILKEIENNRSVWFADMESYKYYTKHIPFLIGFMHQEDKDVKIVRTVEEFLDDVISREKERKNKIIYFHNCKYDYSVMFSNIEKISECVKDNMFYSTKIKYKNVIIELRDTFKHCTMPLSSFKKAFSLNIGKMDEYMPYDLYKISNIEKMCISDTKLFNEKKYKKRPDKYYEYVKDYLRDGKFYHMDFMKEYLKYDVLVLKEGFLKHRKEMLETTGLDIFNYLTSSSIADNYLKIMGCYKDVYEIKGNLRRFVDKAIIGGRVCTLKNQKHHVFGKIVDFDAVSLYPSAMHRMKGFPKGMARVLKNPKDAGDNYYVAKIKITHIGKRQQIPFITYIDTDDNNKRMFDDSDKALNRIYYVDKVTLEDLIEFQDIKFKFITGVYWPDGYNSTIKNVIQSLFNRRLECKRLAKENPDYLLKSEALKLLMNSSYGKTLLKESKTTIDFAENKDQFKNYLSKNYNKFISASKLNNGQYRIISRCNPFGHTNRAHCGCSVLSMSKRIMNEMMNLANDNDIKIFYTDTDSVHCFSSGIDKLAELYKEKYGKVLIGENMEQFHSDFKIFDKETGRFVDAYSKELIIIGKKVYMDKLVSSDEKLEDIHSRMKGVGTKISRKNCIEKKYEKYLELSKEDREVFVRELQHDMYLGLLNGVEKDFDMCITSKPCFDTKIGRSVHTKEEFIRKLHFPGDVNMWIEN